MKPSVNVTINDETEKYRFQYYPSTLPDDNIENVTQYFNNIEFPTEYRTVMGTRSYGSIFVELANINVDSLLKKLNAELQIFINGSIEKDTLLLNFETILKRQYGILYDPILQILMIELMTAVERIEIFTDQIKNLKSKLNEVNSSSDEQLIIKGRIYEAQSIIDDFNIMDSIKIACDYCSDYCSLVAKKYDINFGHTNIEIRCNITLNKNNTITMNYIIEDLFAIASLEHFKIVSHHIPIKVCENCGKYFIPLTRSDEKYCNNHYKDGKTCKELGYETKLKKDKFKTTYRSAYKTQRARIKYNSHITNYEELHFKPWEQAAKQALSDFTTKNDVEGFKKWLIDHKDSF